MAPVQNKVATLQDFVRAVNEVLTAWAAFSTTTHPWFRGQGDAQWPLLPRLYRHGENPLFEREMSRDFRLRATAFLNFTPANGLEWMFVMQHYGMPTRLLDWTESHLTALYFAVLDYQSARDAAVWVLDPWSLNQLSIAWQSVPPSSEKELAKYVLKPEEGGVVIREVEGEKPVAVRPARSTQRIVAQRGTFTIHGKATDSLNEVVKDSGKGSGIPEIRLQSIAISGHSKKKILKELLLAGISHSVIFPDLDGLSKEIHFRYSRQYLG